MRKCNKVAGIPFEVATRTCLMRGGYKLIQYSYDIKHAFLSAIEEQRKKKKRKINSTIGRFSNSPGYDAIVFNDRKERAIKPLTLKVFSPIIGKLAVDSQFCEANNPTFNPTSDVFKRLKVLEKKRFLFP